MDTTKNIQTDCWDKALDSLAYSYIYDKKIEKLGKILRLTRILGILIPVFLGGLVSIYYTNKEIMDIAILFTGPLALIQLAASAYLQLTGADQMVQERSLKSAEYGLLNSEFEQMAKHPMANKTNYTNRFQVLVERERGIGKKNYEVTDKDRRMGMRYGLREYRRECAGCGIAPLSMKPTDCDVCGNF